MSVTLGAVNPNAGETVAFTFNLPDGTTATLTLEATASATPGPNQFTIGATPADTATNLQAALTSGLGTLANTSLAAASAIAASDNFFNIDATHPPLRVGGPPFASATALVAGTSADTVSLVHRRIGDRSGACFGQGADRLRERVIRAAGERRGHPLARAAHGGACGCQLLKQRS